MELFSPAGSEHPYFADFGWRHRPADPPCPPPTTKWTRRGRTARARQGRDAHLGQRRRAGLQAHLSRSTRNTCSPSGRRSRTHGTRRSQLFPYGVVSRTGLPQTAGYYILHEGLIGYLGDEGLQEIKYKKLDDSASITPAKPNSGWLGITDKYWAAAAHPRRRQAVPAALPEGRRAAASRPTRRISLAMRSTVPAGGTAEHDTRLFAGAKETRRPRRLHANARTSRTSSC